MSKDYYEEFKENQVRKLLKTRKKKKLKKRFKILIVLVVIGIIAGYFISDLSRVKSIKVSGNSDVKTETITKGCGIDTSTIYLFINKSKVAENVKDISMIKDCKVSCDLLGNVKIKVEESEKIAYCVLNKKTYVIDESGDVVSTSDSKLIEKLKSSPKLSNFKTVKFLKTFAKEYAKVPELVQSQVSDIIYAPLSSDENRVRFILNNGKELILRIDDMADELERFPIEAYMSKFTNKCTFDFYGDNIYMSDCEDEN